LRLRRRSGSPIRLPGSALDFDSLHTTGGVTITGVLGVTGKQTGTAVVLSDSLRVGNKFTLNSFAVVKDSFRIGNISH